MSMTAGIIMAKVYVNCQSFFFTGIKMSLLIIDTFDSQEKKVSKLFDQTLNGNDKVTYFWFIIKIAIYIKLVEVYVETLQTIKVYN